MMTQRRIKAQATLNSRALVIFCKPTMLRLLLGASLIHPTTRNKPWQLGKLSFLLANIIESKRIDQHRLRLH